MVVKQATPRVKDTDMGPRLDLMTNKTAAAIGKRFYAVSLAIQDTTLPKSLQDLLMLRASQINGCGYCIDYHSKDAQAAGEAPLRLHLVAGWRESSVFTPAERAALALTEEGTRIADAFTGVSDATWAEACEHFDDDQMGALVYLVAMINAANRLGVITRTQGGSYQPA